MGAFARRSERVGPRAEHAARRGLWGVARIVSLIATVVVGLVVLGIVLVLLEANRDNAIMDWLIGAGEFLADPFDGILQPDGRKARIAANWGLAAVVYAIVGAVIVRLFRR
jgi:hypothetical protein